MVEHLEIAEVIDAKVTETPRFYSASGYGKKIPTQYMVQLTDKKWRRVYVVCFSNSGSAYIQKGDKDLYLSPEVEWKLEDLKAGAR